MSGKRKDQAWGLLAGYSNVVGVQGSGADWQKEYETHRNIELEVVYKSSADLSTSRFWTRADIQPPSNPSLPDSLGRIARLFA